MKKELNIFDILHYAPDGTLLYSQDFGKVYLHTVSIDNYRNGWLGNDKAIKVTRKMPKGYRSQFACQWQYRYEDIHYCFDEYGHLYVTDPRHRKDDAQIAKELATNNPGISLMCNGSKLYTSDCRLFPDENMTWENWQLKLFRPGDLVRVEYRTCADRPDDKIICVGYVQELHQSQLGKEFYILLNDVVKEIVVDRRHDHVYVEKFTASVYSHTLWLESGFTQVDITCMFATADESRDHDNMKRILLNPKSEGVWKPFPFDK